MPEARALSADSYERKCHPDYLPGRDFYTSTAAMRRVVLFVKPSRSPRIAPRSRVPNRLHPRGARPVKGLSAREDVERRYWKQNDAGRWEQAR